MRHFSLLEFTPNLEATLLGSVGICSDTPYITLDTNTPKSISSPMDPVFPNKQTIFSCRKCPSPLILGLRNLGS